MTTDTTGPQPLGSEDVDRWLIIARDHSHLVALPLPHRLGLDHDLLEDGDSTLDLAPTIQRVYDAAADLVDALRANGYPYAYAREWLAGLADSLPTPPDGTIPNALLLSDEDRRALADGHGDVPTSDTKE